MAEESKNRWLPLESNPEVMNKYVTSLGMPADWQFSDVIGFDPELLSFVQQPVKAVLLLYPITEKSEGTPLGEVKADQKDVYFMKQFIGNACGTIGLIHAVLNNEDALGLPADKELGKFLATTKEMSPEERGRELEKNQKFSVAHEESAQEGQTKAPGRDEKVDNHFVAFIHHAGGLYELDGRKDGPVFHGSTTPEQLLSDAAEVVKKFMARDPSEVNFSVVALNKN